MDSNKQEIITRDMKEKICFGCINASICPITAWCGEGILNLIDWNKQQCEKARFH